VRVARDGEEALALVRREPPGLVVADVMMPRLSGHELLAALRKEPALARVPVVFLTALTSSERRAAALRDGVSDYVQKPFDEQELLARIANLIRLHALAGHLERQVATQTGELGRLAVNLSQVQEQERRRLARELHDELGQVLSGLQMEIEWLAPSPQRRGPDPAAGPPLLGGRRARCCCWPPRGAAVLVASAHLATLFLGLETLSVALFGLVAWRHDDPRALEAGLEYLVLAGASTAVLLFGAALLYAGSGALGLDGLLALASDGVEGGAPPRWRRSASRCSSPGWASSCRSCRSHGGSHRFESSIAHSTQGSVIPGIFFFPRVGRTLRVPQLARSGPTRAPTCMAVEETPPEIAGVFILDATVNVLVDFCPADGRILGLAAGRSGVVPAV
jgi:CheY-like chemotaxis protein